ncbi:hypothetical protein [Parabacteroides sp. PF5-9]|uniref:TolB family protein n=1 Tax=Parabacteroides sp. PF5-9 TaxID=1742404 RepID=UPI0024759B8D|nr:hypothetical protein [Parabacteroides sp. PF5-9]MDH6358438.1 hypothetical protein [Parabacteroides sp. PF5-9]
MKTRSYYPLLLIFFLFIACDKDGEEIYSDMLSVADLRKTVVGDHSVTFRWGEENIYSDFSTPGLQTRCMPYYNVSLPTSYEIYQSSHPENGFEKIEEITYRDFVTHTVNNLPNGIPVYFYVKSIRKGFESRKTSTIMLVPGIEPKTELFYTGKSQSVIRTVFSPDLEKVAHVESHYSQESLFFSSINESVIIQLLAGSNSDPYWSYDSKQLLFTANSFNLRLSEEPSYISLYDLETQAIKPLTKERDSRDRFPVFSKDNTKVFYFSYEVDSYQVGIRILDLETMEDEQFIDLQTFYFDFTQIMTVIMAVTDQFILFEGYQDALTRVPPVPVPPPVSLYILSLEDKQIRPLFPSLWDDKSPAVSPDGNRVAFLSNRSGSYQIWVYDINLETYRQVTGSQNDDEQYRYDHYIGWLDDSTLYYGDHSGNLSKIELDN